MPPGHSAQERYNAVSTAATEVTTPSTSNGSRKNSYSHIIFDSEDIGAPSNESRKTIVDQDVIMICSHHA